MQIRELKAHVQLESTLSVALSLYLSQERKDKKTNLPSKIYIHKNSINFFLYFIHFCLEHWLTERILPEFGWLGLD